MFDLNTLAIKDSLDLHLKHPVTEELLYADAEKTQPVTITLWSTSSKPYRAAINAMQNRALKRGNKTQTAEQVRDEGTNLLAACSQSSKNLAYNGESVNDTETFRQLYNDDKFSWLKGQVDSALGDVSNFIPA